MNKWVADYVATSSPFVRRYRPVQEFIWMWSWLSWLPWWWAFLIVSVEEVTSACLAFKLILEAELLANTDYRMLHIYRQSDHMPRYYLLVICTMTEYVLWFDMSWSVKLDHLSRVPLCVLRQFFKLTFKYFYDIKTI